jgi:hypothetical protein
LFAPIVEGEADEFQVSVVPSAEDCSAVLVESHAATACAAIRGRLRADGSLGPLPYNRENTEMEIPAMSESPIPCDDSPLPLAVVPTPSWQPC